MIEIASFFLRAVDCRVTAMMNDRRRTIVSYRDSFASAFMNIIHDCPLLLSPGEDSDSDHIFQPLIVFAY